MSFSAFSKEFTANMFTAVENQFIVKYLPHANGDAVRVYLYGLYMCSCKEEFDGESLARLLKIPYETVLEIYTFWEECDLVHVLSRNPLYVEYLPVNAAVGKPKPVRPEKYAQFNRELLRQLQRAGKDFKPYEMQRILEFLENNPMEPQAFLLVSEYCVRKDGEKLTCNHILNKAKKLCADYKFTYEQVENELADFNLREKEIGKLFTQLGIYRKPQESDYAYLTKWSKLGMEEEAVLLCAKALKKGSLTTLDALVEEVSEAGAHTAEETAAYLKEREELADIVFQVARKLSLKVENPRAYIEEYAKRWHEIGYDGESLSMIAALSFRFGYGFSEMDALIERMHRRAVVSAEQVKKYCNETARRLQLLQSLQNIVGVVKKSQTTVDIIGTWKEWNFSDEMILEAARRSTGASAPLPYINKLLSEWKQAGVFTVDAIPEKTAASKIKSEYKSESVLAADRRTEREHYYSVLRERAIAGAENAKKKAAENEVFRKADAEVKRTEIALARAEVFSAGDAAALREQLEALRNKRRDALSALGLTDADFTPRYACPKCSDTGFLPDGKVCDCYLKEKQ